MDIKDLNNKLETLESKYNELGVNCKGLLKLVEDGFNKVSSTTKYLEEQIPDINQETTETIKLNERYDELESKYFTLLSRYDNLDSKINSVFDILKGVVFDWELQEDLQELENKIVEDMQEKAYEYEAEQMMIDENNKLNEEV